VDKETFSIELRQTLEAELTLGHPVFKELFAEQRNWTLLKMITLEGYQITKYFLEYIENLFFHCPIPEHKRRLLYNLFEEETGRFSKTKNHVELMRDFIRAQGISDEERDAHRPSAQTQELIDYRLQAVKGKHTYHIGAAAVMIASEGQSLETKAGEARHSILGKVYGSRRRTPSSSRFIRRKTSHTSGRAYRSSQTCAPMKKCSAKRSLPLRIPAGCSGTCTTASRKNTGAWIPAMRRP
jgi:hypothetical protein